MAFNQIVLIIAAVLLILTLIVLGILLWNSHGALKYPPDIGSCPDYWNLRPDASGGSECHNTHSLGACHTGWGQAFDSPGTWARGRDGNVEKCRWAKECELTWDGITNADYC